jgi:hypothetical protein
VIFSMCPAAKTAEQAVDDIRVHGQNVSHFSAEMPTTVKAIAILERTNEDVAGGPRYT